MNLDKPPYFLSLFSNVIVSFSETEKILYLTFDDGPNPDITTEVLDILDRYNAKATFFCVGENIVKYPDTYNLILSRGHSTGNHTYNHLKGWATKDEIYYDNIEKCSSLISSNLFRPPYGKISLCQLLQVKKMYKVILWTVLARDFDENFTNEDCYNKVIKYAKSGSIITFHDSIKSKEKLLYALPKFLDYFSKLGYSFNKIN